MFPFIRPLWEKHKRRSKRKSNLRPPSSILTTPFVKHSTQFLAIMSEIRVSNFFILVSETSSVLKFSMEQVLSCMSSWQGCNNANDDDNVLLKKCGEQYMNMSEFGGAVIRLGEILGHLQELDPLSFWSSVQSEYVNGALVPMTKDIMKLKRKLIRITTGMVDHMNAIKSIQYLHCCQQVATTIVDEEDDQIWETCDSFSSLGEDSDISKVLGTQCPVALVLRFIRSVFNIKSSSSHSPKLLPNKKSPKAQKTARSHSVDIPDVAMILSKGPSDIHRTKIASSLTSRKYQLDFDLGNDKSQDESQDVIIFDNANDTGTDEKERVEFETNPLITDAKKRNPVNTEEPYLQSKERKSPNQVEEKLVAQTETLKLAEEQVNRAENLSPTLIQSRHSICSNATKLPNDEDKTESGPAPVEEKKDVQVILQNLLTRERTSVSDEYLLEREKQDDHDDSMASQSQIFGRHKEKSRSKEEYRKKSKEFHEVALQMKDLVAKVTHQIRQVENSWLTASTKGIGFKTIGKLSEMMEYIEETVKVLVEDPVDKKIYPETRRHILDAVDPVTREYQGCFIAFAELTQLVSVDAWCLKELFSKLPLGELVVYEFNSDSSIGSFDQIENAANMTATKYALDVDALFS